MKSQQSRNKPTQMQEGLEPIQQVQIYNDDQEIAQKVKQTKTKTQAKVTVQILAQRTMVKLKEKTQLPAMCTINAEGGSRASIDLICVLDVSGSMMGPKIQLLKNTMTYLIDVLNPQDRLCIITFNSNAVRHCNLRCVTKQSLTNFQNIIRNIHAGGGTTINNGMQMALKVLRQRKFHNQITSIFLLSDGQDKGADNAFKATLAQQINQQLPVFSIQSFGFGQDHDEDLMNNICLQKDGAFYYIKELASLDEAFGNALAGILSSVASEFILKISNISKNLVQGIKIKKTYGTNWEKISDTEYRIKILQLMSGASKDFVFLLQIPNIDAEVGDIDRDHNVIEGIWMAKGLNGEKFAGENLLKLTLLNSNQQIPQINENILVVQNYLRSIASEAITQNIKLADQGQYEEAKRNIQGMVEVIRKNKRARPQQMEKLVNDLGQIEKKCERQDYQRYGKKMMRMAENFHTDKRGMAYQNRMQQEWVQQRRQKRQ